MGVIINGSNIEKVFFNGNRICQIKYNNTTISLTSVLTAPILASYINYFTLNEFEIVLQIRNNNNTSARAALSYYSQGGIRRNYEVITVPAQSTVYWSNLPPTVNDPGKQYLIEGYFISDDQCTSSSGSSSVKTTGFYQEETTTTTT